MIKMGTRFYDSREGRYITPDGVGCNPKVYSCIVEEETENGLEMVDRQLFTEYELRRMEEV